MLWSKVFGKFGKTGILSALGWAATLIPGLGLPTWAGFVIAGALAGGQNYVKHKDD